MEEMRKTPREATLEAYFETFDKASEEPIIVASRNEARFFNQYVSEEGVDAYQAGEVITKLDDSVELFMNKPVSVSGVLRYVDLSTNELTEGYFEDIPGIFNGYIFTIANLQDRIRMEQEQDDEDQPWAASPGAQEIQYQIRIAARDLFGEGGVDPAHEYATLFVSTTLDSQLEFDGLSDKRAAAWLEVNHPEIMEELEARLLGPAVESEAHLIGSLKGYVIDVTQFDDQETLRRAVHLYANTLFPLDKEVPYSAVINGEAARRSEETGEFTTLEVDSADTALLFQFQELTAIALNAPDGSVSLGLYIKARMLAENYTLPGLELYILPDAFEDVTSLRYAYYHSGE